MKGTARCRRSAASRSRSSRRTQSRWLAFQQKELDYINVPETFAPNVLDGDKLEARAARRKASVLYRVADPDLTYTCVQLPRSGRRRLRQGEDRAAPRDGDGLQRRRARSSVVRKGQAMHVQMPIPPGVVGHDPHYRSIIQYDPEHREQAARLLRLQEGRGRLAHAAGRQAARHAARHRSRAAPAASSTSCGSKSLRRDRHPHGGRRSRRSSTTSRRRRPASCRCGARRGSPTIPDGDNFMQLLYGPNTGQSNNGCYESKAFDAFYEKSQRSCPIRRSATGCSSR